MQALGFCKSVFTGEGAFRNSSMLHSSLGSSRQDTKSWQYRKRGDEAGRRYLLFRGTPDLATSLWNFSALRKSCLSAATFMFSSTSANCDSSSAKELETLSSTGLVRLGASDGQQHPRISS
eukprot:scaffold35751_cov88-Skeletonema_marinoi.AAC.2